MPIADAMADRARRHPVLIGPTGIRLRRSPTWLLHEPSPGVMRLRNDAVRETRAVQLTSAERAIWQGCEGADGQHMNHIALSVARSVALVDCVAAIRTLVGIGALEVLTGAYPSPYTDRMATEYAAARRIPERVVSAISRMAAVGRQTRVLDLGCGAGDVAVGVGLVSEQVTAMDVSDTFLRLTAERAWSQGIRLRIASGSADRLVLGETTYDVVVTSQVVHWIGERLLSLGLAAALVPSGTLVAVESKAALPIGHPLRDTFGYGRRTPEEAEAACVAHARRYALAFARTESQFHRLRDLRVFCEHRSFDQSFARAYFFDSYVLGRGADGWERLEHDLQGTQSGSGRMYWMVACYGA